MSGPKQALREQMTAARLRLSSEERSVLSHAVARRVLALDLFDGARTLGLYAPMGAEVDTAEIARAAAARGKRVAYPRLVPGARALGFAACDEGALRPGALRTREPPPEATAVPLRELDAVFVPGLAFDAGARRLGRGRGHYDATLAALPPAAAKVGLAFELQIVAAVPCEDHDVALDVVVTEAAVRFRPRESVADGDTSH